MNTIMDLGLESPSSHTCGTSKSSGREIRLGYFEDFSALNDSCAVAVPDTVSIFVPGVTAVILISPSVSGLSMVTVAANFFAPST